MRTYSVPLILINLQDDGFHLLVEIVVFGQRHFAVLDTGASRSVFDQQLVKAHVPESDWTSGEAEATTLFSTSSSIQTCIPEIGIGPGIKVLAYETICLDLASVNSTYEQMGHPAIAAIVGSDILVKYQAKIDYKKLKLYLSK